MTRPPVKAPSSPWLVRIRDGLLLVIGGGGFVYEAIVASEPRAILIGAYLLMLGLPAFSGVDRLFQRNGDAPPPPEPDPQEPAP